MIEKMTKYSFILMNEDKEKFIEQLSALGVMDITRAKKPMDERSTKIYADAYSKDPEFFELWRTLDSYKKTIPSMNKILTTDIKYFENLY